MATCPQNGIIEVEVGTSDIRNVRKFNFGRKYFIITKKNLLMILL